jgi:hypothetical protein
MLDWLVECETTPPDLGMNELVNCWEDWVPSPLPENYFPEPVFAPEEERLIRGVSSAIDAFCDATPKSVHDDFAELRLPQWAAVVAAAKVARIEMMKRGRMPEEEELSL